MCIAHVQRKNRPIFIKSLVWTLSLLHELGRKWMMKTTLGTPLKKVKVKSTQLCLTLCDPMDSTFHGILQAGILEWVAFPFSRVSSQPRDRTQVSCIAGGFFTSWATREAQELFCLPFFFFSSKMKICCPKARCPFTLYSLFRWSLFVYNVLSFLTQERFLNYCLHPFLSPKYMPSDLGILKRHYSFLK